jgi:hypothetical protein
MEEEHINQLRKLTADEFRELAKAKNSPLWKLVLDTIAANLEVELSVALAESTPSELRGYTAGRAAALRDLSAALVDLQKYAQTEHFS